VAKGSRSSFATVGSDFFYPSPTHGLYTRPMAYWSVSSLFSDFLMPRMGITEGGVSFPAGGSTKPEAFSLRCVYP